jgi:hypothetical protein
MIQLTDEFVKKGRDTRIDNFGTTPLNVNL